MVCGYVAFLIFDQFLIIKWPILDNYTISFTLVPILSSVESKILEVITGNILGDGSIGNSSKDGRIMKNGRYRITIKASSLPYIEYLSRGPFSHFNPSDMRPYPNVILSQNKDKQVLHYSFETKISEFFGTLHSL